MQTRFIDPRHLMSRAALLAEADDIERAIAGNLENDPRSASTVVRSTMVEQRSFTDTRPKQQTALAA